MTKGTACNCAQSQKGFTAWVKETRWTCPTHGPMALRRFCPHPVSTAKVEGGHVIACTVPGCVGNEKVLI